MKTIILLRHAKSAWDDPDLPDHDRPLSERGREDAATLGRIWQGRQVSPELVVTSSARRTQQTLELVQNRLDAQPPVTVERELYLCGRRAWLERLRRLPAEVETVLVVGHNPDLHDLALYLVGSGDKDLRKSLARKFPTCASVTLRVETEDWRTIDHGVAQLVAFDTPSRLSAA